MRAHAPPPPLLLWAFALTEGESPPACLKMWAELTEQETEAAHVLGYDAAEWDLRPSCFLLPTFYL